jgi:hypothetical protein
MHGLLFVIARPAEGPNASVASRGNVAPPQAVAAQCRTRLDVAHLVLALLTPHGFSIDIKGGSGEHFVEAQLCGYDATLLISCDI